MGIQKRKFHVLAPCPGCHHNNSMSSKTSVAVIGSSGAVGQEIVRLLEREPWRDATISLFGSERSAGSSVPFRGENLTVNLLSTDNIVGYNIVFVAATSNVSRHIVPILASFSTFVVDNTSAFRMDPSVPLVIPEINFDSIAPGCRLVANPNCCTIIMLMAVAPLRVFGRIRRIIVSTYQSASGAGRPAMEELETATRAALDGRPFEPQVLPHPYGFNLFSHNTPIGPEGYNGEEEKIIAETRKILDDPEIMVNPTCVRVPVLRSHSESITVEFDGPAPAESDVREVLATFPGVCVVDDRENNRFPMPIDANGQGDVLVGRIRKDISNPNALSLFVCGDQLLKGAALNAVQIAEKQFA